MVDDVKKFKKGDTCRLDTGEGPLMAVTDVKGDDVATVWFTTDFRMEVGVFPSYVLYQIRKGL